MMMVMFRPEIHRTVVIYVPCFGWLSLTTGLDSRMVAPLSLSDILRPICFSIPRCHTKLSFLHNAPLLCQSPASSLKSNFLGLPHPCPLAALNFSLSVYNLSLQGQEIGQPQDEEAIAGVGECADSVSDSGSVDTPVGGLGGPADKPEAKKPSNVPNLTVKEKKELASYAHGLRKKLKSQQIKIHRTCPGELEDVFKHLEDSATSVVVGQIGCTVIMYRPSITKMKAEEKRKQARVVFLRRKTKASTLLSRKEHVTRLYGRGQQRATRV